MNAVTQGFRLVSGEVTLDEDRFELCRNGERIAVQPKVLELILYLAKNRDRVVTKDELFSTVWEGTSVTDASLSQALRLARQALGDTASEQRILRTTRGRGVRFVADESASIESARHAIRPVEPALDDGNRTANEVRTELETQKEAAATALCTLSLLLVASADDVTTGGVSLSLQDVDEVRIGRGAQRRVSLASPRVVELAIPGRRLSRRHARLVRASTSVTGWMLVDERSRNGTRLGGALVERATTVGSGDMFSCGETLFRLEGASIEQSVADDLGLQQVSTVFHTITPTLRALEEKLERVIRAGTPVLLHGESGTGKTASAIALLKQATGSTPEVLAGVAVDSWPETASCVVFDDIDRIAVAQWDRASRTVRACLENGSVVLTSQVPLGRLRGRVPDPVAARIGGYEIEMPALRHRVGDIGGLISVLFELSRPVAFNFLETLARYHWPGNLHQFEHVIRAAAAAAGDGELTLEHLPGTLRQDAASE